MNLLKELDQSQNTLQTDLKKSDATDAGSKDVVSKAAVQGDISFSLLRNTINRDGKVTGSEVSDYIERAEELNDEVDTVPFGLETNDGQIVKVYVNATQADEFEEAMKVLLGLEDDIEEAINNLATKFDIVDVVWPRDSENEDEEAEDLDLDGVELDPEDDEDFADDNFDVVASVDDDAVETDTKKETAREAKEENSMSIGTHFLARVLNEAAQEDRDGVNDGFNIPLDSQARALVGKLKLPIAKRLVAFYVMAGVPGRYLNTEDVQSAVVEAADMLRKRVAVRRAFDSLYKALAVAKGLNLPAENTAVQEAARGAQKRGSFIQKLFETVLVELGLPESLITTTGPAAVGVGIYRTAEIIEQDASLERALRLLATRLGIRQTDVSDTEQKGVTEAIDVGNDDFAEAVVGLVSALGIPDDILQRRRTQVIQALREKRRGLRNRAQILTMIGRLQDLLGKNQVQPGGQDDEEEQ